MIPKHTIDEIFEAAIVEDVVGEFVPLKKRGVNYLGNCPFHNEKTPSFTVSPAKGIYKCFGCGASGNSVKFLMEHEHYSYPEALKYLANKYNIEVEEEEQTDEQKEAANERESLYIVSNYAANYFKKQLHESDEGKAIGLSYFIERGFREDIIDKFQLGYNPNDWTAFTDAAEKEGYNLKYLEKSGLTIVKEKKKFDRFKGRVMFPIHNLSGRVLGFGGRILKSDDKAAKYLNSPESEIYNKSKVLYGIYYAKKAITQENNCYLVEGYTDVISLHQSGVENVVSSSGTSLTEGQIRLISRFTPNITILYDGDAAGLKASFRGIDMILKEGMNVRVVLFPEGEDPDSYAKNHTTEELKGYITDNAQDFIRFKTNILIKDVGEDPIKKAEVFIEIAKSVASVNDPIKRSNYVTESSSFLKVPEPAFLSEVNKFRQKIVIDEQKQKKQLEEKAVDELINEDYISQTTDNPPFVFTDLAHWENDVIRLLITYGDKQIEVEAINPETQEQYLQEVAVAFFIINSISNDNIVFENPNYQEILSVYVEHLNEQKLPDHQDFVNHHNPAISKIIIDVFSEKYSLANWENHKIYVTKEEELLKKAVVNTMYAFKLSKLNKRIAENQDQLKMTDANGQIELLKEQLTLQQLKKQLAEKLGRIILK